MSKTIDEKVVEMKFDNKNFENNVKQTLVSLDKLKQSLNLPESSKGLESIRKELSKVDVSNLTSGLESAKLKFSALEVMGVTALANITNSAMNAGKRIVSALTIEPVTTGFQEYELKMDSVRTIMASTGEDIETVNKYLDELNTYSDRTIYKFSDMTQNIGKFTNAGVKLEDAVIAMKGLSNEAAVSGANTQEAARAMYNFAQALSMGYVQLIDWKSIENANMATVEFKQNLIDTAVQMGKVTKTTDGLYKTGKKAYNLQAAFKDGLKDQWLTTDVLLATLKDYGSETTDIGKKAYAAAQDVTKFTQMWDVLKETAQSGWAKTWETVIGDMNKAKSLFSPMTKFFSDIIDKVSDARNALLESALSKNFKSLFDNIKQSTDSIKQVVESVKDYGKVVDEIIGGKFGNGQARWDKLTESGYDWAHAQNLVNERLGSSVRHATDFDEKQQQLTKSQQELTNSTSDYIVELSKMSDIELKNKGMADDRIKALRDLQEASEKTGIDLKELIDNIDNIDGRFLLLNSFKNIGKSLVKTIGAIGNAWRDAFPPMSSDTLFNLIAGLHKFSVTISNFVDKNVENLTRTLKGLFAVLDIIATFAGGGFKIAFTILQGVLEGLGYSFGNVLELTAFLGDKLAALRDLINGGIVKGVSFLTNKIKGAIKAFRDWYNTSDKLSKGLEVISSAFKKVTEYIKDFVTNNSVLQGMFKAIYTGFEKIGNSIAKLDPSKVKDIGKNIIDGLVSGIGSGIKKVVETIIHIATTIIDTFARILNIKSPSRVFFDMGEYIIQGLLNGIQNGNSKVAEVIKNLGNNIKKVFEKINIGRFLAIMTDAIVAHIASPKLVAAYGLAKTLLGGFGVYVFNIFETIQNGASNADFITNNITKIGESFKNLLNNIKTWFSEMKDTDNIGLYIVQGLANGILNGFKIIGTVVLNLANVIKTTICKALGIESPSKVFFAIGGFIVLGLVAGLKDKLGLVPDVIKNLATTLVNTFKQIDFGKIFAAGLAVGLLYTANKIIKTINAITSIAAGVISPLKALANMLNSIGTGINNYFTDKGKAEKIRAMGSAVKDFAISIAILAGSIFLLSKIEYSNDMWKLFGYLSALVGVMIVLAGAMALINKIPNNNSNKLTTSLLALSASIFLLSSAIKVLGNINADQLKQGLGALATVLGGLAIYMIAYGKFVKGKAAQNMNKAATLLFGLSVSLLIMTKVIKSIAGLSVSDLTKSIIAIGAIELLFVALIGISALAGKRLKDINKLGFSMIAMAIALKTMLGVVKAAAKLDINDVLNGVACLAIIDLLFIALIKVSAIAGQNAAKAGAMILEMSLAFVILIGVIKLVGKLKPEEILKGLAFITAVGVLFTALIAVSNLAGENAIKAGAMLLEASISLLILAGVLFLLGKMNYDEISKALEIVLALGVMFAGLIAVSKLAGNATKVIISISASIAILTAALIALSFVDLNKLKSAVIALSAIMVALTALIASTALVTKSGVGLATIIVLSLVISALVGMLFLLTNLETEGLKDKVLALSVLLGTMAGVLGVLTLVGMAGPAALIGIGSLIALITSFGVLIGIFGALNKDGKLEELLNNGLPLLEKVAYGIGSFVGNLIKGFAESALSILPYMGMQLSLFMVNLTPFIVGSKMIDSSVLEGIGYLSAAIIALSVAEFIQAISDFLSFGSSLPDLGTKLSNFMINCLPFIATANLINPESISGVKTLVEAIMLLSAAELIDGMTSLFGLFSKKEDADTFAEKLQSLGKGVKAFADEVSGIKNISSVKDAAEAAKILIEIANAIPNEGGLISKITGDNDLGAFAEKLKPFGEGLKAYGDSVKDLNVGSIEDSVRGAKAIIDIAKTIPNEGGLLAKITGDNDLGAFAEKLSPFGTGLQDYAIAVKDLDVGSIENSVNGAQALIDMAKTIPNEGGWLAAIVGDNGIGEFGKKLEPFGKGLKDYSIAVQGLDTASIENSEKVFDIVNNIIKKLSSNVLGNPLDFNQRTNNSDFVTPLINIANSIKRYIETVRDLDLVTITNSETCINKLKDILTSLNNIEYTGIDSFIEAINSLSQVSITQLTTQWDNASIQFYNIGHEVMHNIILGIESNQLSLITLISITIDEMLEQLNISNIRFYNMGILIFTNLGNGMKKHMPVVRSIIISFIVQTLDSLRGFTPQFHQCGVDFGQGLVNGIRSMRQIVYMAAYELGQAAVQGERDGQNSHSPSKETIQSGIWLGEGLIIGIKSISGKVQQSASDMGKDTTDSISSALSLANTLLNSDSINEPTIRPVLDLSDVTSKANSIHDLLNTSPTVGVTANLRSISRDMNSRSQNGNNDVVESINELRKDINNMPKTNSYNINGVTYDDGSNISQAVETLVEAITVERRI